jgi:zinc finger protein
MSSDTQPSVVYLNINPDEPVQEIESLCMNCHEQGLTRFLLCSIPYFRDIVIMSFNCEHCGFSNSEVQSAANLAEKGIRITLIVNSPEVLNRQVVKSEYGTISIPEIQLEIPNTTQKASLNTIEGILSRAAADLEQDQPLRRELQPEVAAKIDEFLYNLNELMQGRPFTFVLDDPAGNSFISFDPQYGVAENDPLLHVQRYVRTKEQLIAMGYMAEDDEITKSMEKIGLDNQITAQNVDFSQPIQEESATEEAIEFDVECFACSRPGKSRMCLSSNRYRRHSSLQGDYSHGIPV